MNWERTEDWQLILGNFDGYIDEVRISAVVQYGADYDGDGLVDQDELLNGTDPLLADTDGDGVDDKVENDAGTNPLDTDSDDDGMPDYIEIFESFSNPLTADFNGNILSVITINGVDISNSSTNCQIEGTRIHRFEIDEHTTQIPYRG